jgi:ubiquinone biosynthesis protein UbiJ
LILALLLPILEKTINHALRYDPVALSKLADIKNQIIEIHCEDWRMRFFIVCESNGLHFEKKSPGTPNTTIQGTLNHFLHLFLKGANTKTLFEYPVDVDGNTKNMEVLRDIFKNLDLDLAEKLSYFLGDALAHQIFHHGQKTKDKLADAGKTLFQQSKEYIHCETRNVVTQKQAEQFYFDIAKLRDDTARLEARIAITDHRPPTTDRSS